jgi:cellulose synthase operon protein YhjU
MSYLSLYFLLKTGLYYGHSIGFHWGLNLLLAGLGFWPLPAGRWQRARAWMVWLLALALLYHDSFLPTPERIWSQLGALGGFSADYLLELVRRIISPYALLGLALVVLVYTALSRWLRFATLAWLAILSVPLMAMLGASTAPADAAMGLAGNGSTAPVASTPDTELQAFYAREHLRKLVFPASVAPPAFDVIVLHVCSLSWDDLDFVNERNAPLLKRFDVLFSNFNSAASYSGPATYRIFRGNCGQSAHARLYQGTDDSCYTFPALEKAGFTTNGLLNHNGIFDGFAKIVEHEGGLGGHMESNRNGTIQMQSFDGSPVYDDYGLLSQWWTQRLKKGSAPVALYYNTISLHDGNRLPGITSRSSLDTYKPRLLKLLADFDRFVTQLEASGRPVVLMLVPEHGASLRGDKVQIPGMREIPDPKITLVPAAIKLIGMKVPSTPGASAGPVLVQQDMSYFGLNTLLADLMRDNPFVPGGIPLAQRLEALETTPFVAENDDVVMLRNPAGGYVLKSNDGTWVPFGKP